MMPLDQKLGKLYMGRVLMTIFLFFALFGLTFGLSITFLNKKTTKSTTDEVIPRAEVKLPKNSPTGAPTPTVALVSQAKIGEGCKVGGCNNEICLNENDEVATSICVYREVFSCYQKAECKKQEGGKCNWSQTSELTSCIKENEETSSNNQFCGGITGKSCPNGYSCKLDGNYPDAGGKCEKD